MGYIQIFQYSFCRCSNKKNSCVKKISKSQSVSRTIDTVSLTKAYLAITLNKHAHLLQRKGGVFVILFAVLSTPQLQHVSMCNCKGASTRRKVVRCEVNRQGTEPDWLKDWSDTHNLPVSHPCLQSASTNDSKTTLFHILGSMILFELMLLEFPAILSSRYSVAIKFSNIIM